MRRMWQWKRSALDVVESDAAHVHPEVVLVSEQFARLVDELVLVERQARGVRRLQRHGHEAALVACAARHSTLHVTAQHVAQCGRTRSNTSVQKRTKPEGTGTSPASCPEQLFSAYEDRCTIRVRSCKSIAM